MAGIPAYSQKIKNFQAYLLHIVKIDISLQCINKLIHKTGEKYPVTELVEVTEDQ